MNYAINGKRFKVSTGTSNKRLAQIKLEDLKVKLFKGEIGAKITSNKRVFIPDFFRRYVEHLKGNSAVDMHSDLARLRILQDFFARRGIRYLESINPSLLDEFRSAVLKGKKPKTVKNYITLLKTAMNKAVEWQLLSHNPISSVKSPKIVKTFHFFSKEGVQKLISAADEPLRTAIKLFVTTGMRRAELFNLRWRDVDLKAKQLRVWPYDEFSPKGKRPRTIPLSETALKTISKLFENGKGSGYVFRPFNNINTLNDSFLLLAKRLEIKGTLHDLRHTFASHLAMAGTPIPVIKELLGHSDISTTMIYAHLSPEIHMLEIKKLPL